MAIEKTVAWVLVTPDGRVHLIVTTLLQQKSFANHTDPELQAIVQGLEVSSPWFRAIFGVLFCDYDVSQGLRG